jgi:hypothetical protein
MSTLSETTEPSNDLIRLIKELCDREEVEFATIAGGGLFFTYLHGHHGPPRLWASLQSQHDWFRVEGEGWGLWSQLGAVRRLRFVREPDSHAPGRETLSIHLVTTDDAPSLRFNFRSLYDDQGQPIAARFAYWEALRERYGGRDEVRVENGTLMTSES